MRLPILNRANEIATNRTRNRESEYSQLSISDQAVALALLERIELAEGRIRELEDRVKYRHEVD